MEIPGSNATISRIKVQGYQALKNVDFTFGMFTVILGESNVGKSSLIRAVQALVNNETGNSFITRGCKKAVVEINFYGGAMVVRWEKGKSAEYLIVDMDGNDSQKYSKVGGQVPDEVVALTRLSTIDLGGGIKFAPNFHSQFDTPFLMDESAPRIAKILGELSGVNLLYKAIAEANLRVRRNSGDLNRYREELEEKREKIKDFAHLKSRAKLLVEAEGLRLWADEVAGEVGDVAASLLRLTQLAMAAKGFAEQVDLFSVYDEVDLSALDVLFKEIEAVEECLDNADTLDMLLTATKRDEQTTGQQLQALETCLQEFVDELGVCPLCEQEMP